MLVTTIDAQWEGMGDVGSARYEPALLPPCPTIRALIVVTSTLRVKCRKFDSENFELIERMIMLLCAYVLMIMF